MRILPLLVYIRDKPVDERYQLVKQVSSITHAHVRSAIVCFYYLEFALGLLNGEEKFAVYNRLQKDVAEYLSSINMSKDETGLFDRLLIDRIDMIPENQIRSSGYVLHTLEASIWCLLNTDSYKDAVLKAVNLGEDTDTTGAVTLNNLLCSGGAVRTMKQMTNWFITMLRKSVPLNFSLPQIHR